MKLLQYSVHIALELKCIVSEGVKHESILKDIFLGSEFNLSMERLIKIDQPSEKFSWKRCIRRTYTIEDKDRILHYL